MDETRIGGTQPAGQPQGHDPDHLDEIIAQSHDMGYSTPATRKGFFWAFMLLGSPSTFLIMLSARYALRDPSCQYAGARIAFEASAFLTVAVSTLIAVLAWRHWRADHLEWSNDAPDPASRDRFLAIVCFTLALVGIAFSLALWAPTLFFAPCDTQ
jgi:hypothetical protein